MKRSGYFTPLMRCMVFCALFSTVFLQATAVNPKLSAYLVNLSSAVNTDVLDDVYPEMVIEGDIIHVLWTEYKYATENWMFYCRSTDLGKTWETPKQIIKLKNSEYARLPGSRELAVDGQNVHIAVVDYDYYASGTASIHYVRSTNGGSTFQPSRVIAVNSGGYNNFRNSHIKAAGGKVAVAYLGSGSKNGLRMLYSTDNGGSFTDTMIQDGITYLSDFWYDGNQMIVLSGYDYYYYGLNVGRVYTSVSTNGVNFTNNKVSVTFKESDTTDREKCASYFDVHYAPKISKSGNTIHVVFMGYVSPSIYTVLYARSTDNGLTFEKARDINNGKWPGNGIQGGQETLVSVQEHVYIAYLTTGAKVFFAASANNGQSFTEAASILPDGFSHIEKTWWISLVPDLADNSGSSVYLTGNSMFSVKTDDGGKTFHGSQLAAPFLNNHMSGVMNDMVLDRFGQKHWIAEMKLRGGTDKDIMYRRLTKEPEPGTRNKALQVHTTWNEKAETVIVPSSAHLNFDSAMTAEAWVKFDPSTADNVSILAKINGYDGADYYSPPGYNIGFRKNQGKFCINNALVTDKGEFFNWGDCTIDDTLWHHIAFTYDARAGLNNFRTYVDGTLRVEKTVTGEIRQGDGMLMIGSRSNFYGNNRYFIDEVRLWNRALSQEELLHNQVTKFTGQEEGLKMYLSFDDTFKDLTGNGNDGIPIYLGPLVSSDFDPPKPGFEAFKSMNEVSFNNRTTNAIAYQWDFGDTKTSDKGNPVYVYPKPGEYNVTLLARNHNSKSAAMGKVTVEGLSHVEPVRAGNSGYALISVHGGGISVTGTTLLLRKQGQPDIAGKELFSPAPGILSARFLLEQAETGKWDVIVKKGTSELKLESAFEVVTAQVADPWVSISGRGAILFNMWQSYTISFGNNGNVDAYGVPVWFAITDDPNLEIEFIDFKLEMPPLAVQKGYAAEISKIGPYFTTDAVLGEAFQARVFPFMVPHIPANTAMSVKIRVKTPKTVRMMVWTNPPWVDLVDEALKSTAAEGQGSKLAAAECVMGVLAEGIVDIGTSAIPGVGCVWSVGKLVYQTGSSVYNQKFSMWNTLWNSAVTFVDCGLNLSGIGAVYQGIGVFLANQAGYAKSIRECNELLKTNSQQGMNVGAVSSFDPNEMVGPAGFGDKQWIQKNKTIPYTVLFENKSTATAPAHIVTVTDTLDLSVFDIRDFGFTSFGWGDTVIAMQGKQLKEFSRDIDLRPALPLITRVSGKLDTISGIIRWEFLSLNPGTMDIEEDPFIGFLPPNNTNHAGEGFVSFYVGVREELKTNDVLKNRASIVFDANEPILTNEYINTLDTDLPFSRVNSLEATTKDYFTVSWSGTDKGSGVGAYTIYVLENNTLLMPWKWRTKETSAVFVGAVGSNYRFYSIATDNVSLYEDDPDGFDAFTTVTVDVEAFEMLKQELKVYPNPASERVTVLFPNAPCGAYVVEMRSVTGQVIVSELHDDYTLANGLNLNVRGLRPGQYFLQIIYGNKRESRTILIK
jgi:PKD repeat protein